jgi:lipopolysaccharide transport system ATP-binding protein
MQADARVTPLTAVDDGRTALRAVNLGKRYDLGRSRVRRLLRCLVAPAKASRGEGGLWAVSDVSFSLEHGRSLGLIGRNGSGKSTLLRLLAGVARPTTGLLELGARLGCLLDLGVGFHPQETGRENAEAALVLLGGMTRREARTACRDVQDFAGVGDFFDRPLRTYSAGMQLRVAFATATRLDPEVLVTDEVLAVGDEAFQRKCARYFDGFLAAGGTLVLCSHDLSQVQRLCDTTLWLDAGRVAELGETRDVIRHYRERMGSAAAGGEEGGGVAGQSHAPGEPAGLPFEVIDLHLVDERGDEVRALGGDATVTAIVDVLAPGGVPNLFIGITREDLTPVYGVASDMDGAIPERIAEGRYRFRITFTALPLTAGRYRLRAHALDETATRLYDTVEIVFSVAGDDAELGLVRLPVEWR